MLRDFYFKLVILVLVMLSVTVFVGSIALLPSYFFSISEKNIAEQKLEIEKLKPVPSFDEKTSNMIVDLDQKLDLIERLQKDKFIVSERVINAISLKRVDGIKINTITYEEDALKVKKISVNGTAASRETLLSFRLSLEQDTSFKKVDLPIANFIKGTNIQFYLTLIPS